MSITLPFPPVNLAVQTDLFGGASALHLAGEAEYGTAGCAEHDAELLTLADKLAALDERRIELIKAVDTATTNFECRQRKAALETVDEQWDELAEQMEEIPARTPAGLDAKARTLQRLLRRLGIDELEHRLAASLVGDLIGVRR